MPCSGRPCCRRAPSTACPGCGDYWQRPGRRTDGHQARANGARCVLAAQQEIASEVAETALVLAVNGIVSARETGAALMAINNNGGSLVWGHPQGQTGLRGVIEFVEELAGRGGGDGLFTGCAAGDTAMAVVIELRDAAA